uniref:Uncharacterized protein n=1 Tax=Trypanosoma congolense (strain IL3000) TaxID=1068625 RepID=G0UNM5_TRYCI|nr:hypothetical protein, unlikely [Trypanosoma congolense IL3000]
MITNPSYITHAYCYSSMLLLFKCIYIYIYIYIYWCFIKNNFSISFFLIFSFFRQSNLSLPVIGFRDIISSIKRIFNFPLLLFNYNISKAPVFRNILFYFCF